MESPGSRLARAAERQAASHSRDRQAGVHYTPPAIAQEIVSRCLNAIGGRSAGSCTNRQPTILDPACGDGALLVAALRELCLRQSATPETLPDTSCSESPVLQIPPDARLQIVQEQLFGVDIDPHAVSVLRTRLLELIDPPPPLAQAAKEAVHRNFVCGDALTGPDFTERSLFIETQRSPLAPRVDSLEICDREHERFSAVRSTRGASGLHYAINSTAEAAEPDAPFVDWSRDFPGIARAGGFDLIVGNPPYVRERDAKELFDRIAGTPLGSRWREARMDLWYYFLHRGLDLLKPGGVLSFIVSSYWLASRGAGKLIARLERETLFDEIVLLDNEPIFDDVQGRHMIFRLTRPVPQENAGAKPAATIVRGLSGAGGPQHAFTLAQHELFQEGRIAITPADPLTTFGASAAQRVEDLYEVRQGMAENPACITGRVRERFGDRFTAGEGVFVLTPAEVERLDLSADERALLRPYFDTRSIGRYRVPAAATHDVLYLGRNSRQSLDQLPRVESHLARFREILEQRRETREGLVPWWQLHWPREERLFTEPRILAVQMGKRPQFTFAERPTFVGFSVNLILARDSNAYSLPALTGILNSRLARGWFERHAKRRGVALEINGHLLRAFPLPPYVADADRVLETAIRQRQSLSDDEPAAAELEQTIEQLVSGIYGMITPK